LALVGSFLLAVGQFARAYRCRRFQGEAALGKDTLVRQTFYGFRVHFRCCWPGGITQFDIAPGNVSETSVVPDLVAGTQGQLLGDCNYWNPAL
jgi:DDE family transposase